MLPRFRNVTMYAESQSQAPNTVVMLGPLVPLPLLEGTSPTSNRVREVPQQTRALLRLPLLEGARPTSDRTERDSTVPPDTRATRNKSHGVRVGAGCIIHDANRIRSSDLLSVPYSSLSSCSDIPQQLYDTCRSLI